MKKRKRKKYCYIEERERLEKEAKTAHQKVFLDVEYGDQGEIL